VPAAHTDTDIERGLTALAVLGDAEKASKQTGYNARTILSWRDRHPDRWAHIETNRARIIDQACIDEFRTIVQEAADVTLLAVRKERENLVAGRTREPGQTALNMAKTAATMADKVAMMEGRPTAIVEHRNADDILRGLEKRGLVVDATATELPAP
jgi:hypothetical protein